MSSEKRLTRPPPTPCSRPPAKPRVLLRISQRRRKQRRRSGTRPTRRRTRERAEAIRWRSRLEIPARTNSAGIIVITGAAERVAIVLSRTTKSCVGRSLKRKARGKGLTPIRRKATEKELKGKAKEGRARLETLRKRRARSSALTLPRTARARKALTVTCRMFWQPMSVLRAREVDKVPLQVGGQLQAGTACSIRSPRSVW